MSKKLEVCCENCKKSFFAQCDVLQKELLELGEKKLFDEREWEIKSKIRDRSCGYECKYIEYPIEVSEIKNEFKFDNDTYRRKDIGKFVKVHYCKDDKTYLGLYLGDLPSSVVISHNPDSKELTLSGHTNPAMYVFDLQKIIFGYESYWSIIKSEDDFKEITNTDIENIWYVKVLKSLSKEDKENE